jgi:hypothetical protein
MAAAGRQLAEQVLGTFHTCTVPEVARLGRTLRPWRTQVLAYFFDIAGSATAARSPST